MAEVTFDRALLDRLLVLLGDPEGDLRFLLPYFEANPGAGADIQDVSSRGFHATNVVAYDNAPVIRGNLLSTRLNGTDEYQEIADRTLLSAISGGIDTAFSVGCAFNMSTANAANKYLICKYDDQTPNREWRLYLDDQERLCFQIIDNDVANAEQGRRDATVMDATIWYIVIGTYDGGGGATAQNGMDLYRWDGAAGAWDGAVDDTDINGIGVYIDMEDTVQPVMIGAADTAAGPVSAEWFPGEVMMPWMTMRELSAGEAEAVALAMVRLMEL